MAMNLVLYAHLTRALGPEHFGVIGWGTALIGFFATFVEMGLGALYIREVAREPGRVSELAGWLVGLRLLLLGAAYVSFLGFLLLLDRPPLVKTTVAVLGLSLVGGAASLDWAYHGTQRLGRLAVRNVLVSAVTLGGALLFVHRSDDLLRAAALIAGGAVLTSASVVPMFVREFGRPLPRFDRAAWAALLRMAVPIGVSLFLIQIYATVGQFFLGLLRPSEEVGWYSGAYRVVLAALVGADILNQAFAPSLSATRPDTPEGRARGDAYGTALAVVGLPLAIGGALYAREVIRWVAGAVFAPGAPALALLLAYTGVSYVGKGYGDPLIAWDRERTFLIAVCVGAVVNVVLNLLLIQPYGEDGAALSTVCAALTVAVIMAASYRRLTGTLHLAARARVLAAALVGVAMPTLAARALGGTLWAAVAISAPAYAIALLAFRVVPTSALRERRIPFLTR